MRKRRIIFGTTVAALLLAAAGASALAGDQPATYTRTFLGKPAEWKDVTIVVRAVSPLFGGREYYIYGDGRVRIIVLKRDAAATDGVVERRFVLEGAQEQVAALLQKIHDVDLMAVPLEQPDQPGPTCNDAPLFLVRNAAGQVLALPVIRGAPTDVYEDVLHDVAKLIRLTRGRQPQYDGAYDLTFIPAGFEWAADTLRSARAQPWAPVATPEQVARAEEQWRAGVQLQLEAIAKKKAEQARQGGAE